MSRVSPHCEHPDHVGSRLVDRRDLWEQRVEFRNVVSQNTGPRITQRHVCTTCMDTVAAVVRDTLRGAPVRSEVLW